MEQYVERIMIKFADGEKEIIRLDSSLKFFIETNLETGELCVLIGEWKNDEEARFPKMGRRIALVRYNELKDELSFIRKYEDIAGELIFAPVHYHYLGHERIVQ